MQYLNATALIGKKVLDVSIGAFSGVVQGVYINDKSLRIESFAVRHEDESVYYLYADAIDHFADEYITVRRSEESETPIGKNILNLPVITVRGEEVGVVEDFLIDKEEHRVREILLSGEYIKAQTKKNVGTIDAEALTLIGQEAILSEASRADLHVEEAAEGRYKKREKEKTSSSRAYEDVFDKVSNSAKDTFASVTEKAKQIDTDSFQQDLARFADTLNKEASKLLDNLSRRFSSKEKKDTMKMDDDVQTVLHDLENHTVTEPFTLGEGDEKVIVLMPGQFITEAVVREALQKEAIATLYRLAVPVARPEAPHVEAEVVEEE